MCSSEVRLSKEIDKEFMYVSKVQKFITISSTQLIRTSSSVRRFY
jgi:hypothetical protein